ncbi:MAG: FAD-dependent oxidoreductase [Lachnospiraceae bacterium]
MLRITELRLPLHGQEEELEEKIRKLLHLKEAEKFTYVIKKKSIDARKKNELQWVYTVQVGVEQEAKVIKRIHSAKVELCQEVNYQIPPKGTGILTTPPVIVGSGPAGLFCALLLAQQGYCPIVIERGEPVLERAQQVQNFWETGRLNQESNVQFGEGGAGTFSDGKLNTLVKDSFGRNKKVLDLFVQMGAPKEITYVNKPHIGTDVLISIVQNMRKEIIRLGGSVQFNTKVTGFVVNENHLEALILEKGTQKQRIAADCVILAIGHSARDTFCELQKTGIELEAKSFAVGFRVEHPQSMINKIQYGQEFLEELGAADYKLTAALSCKRGLYSFCMCPGGFIVNASSEQGKLAINGMSYSKRESGNANSAIILSVTPEDYPDKGPLGGMHFQQKLEEMAFSLGKGRIPQQLFGDFEANIKSTAYGSFSSKAKGDTTFANLRALLPKEWNEGFCEGMHLFAKKIKGFDQKDCILSGIESRTSSPVRMVRNEELESNVKGLYPCGEGAGYAGGIMSAAMDGLKVAEVIIRTYASK